MASRQDRKIELAHEFFADEYIDYTVYSELAKGERHRELRILFEKLAKMERGHMIVWEKILIEGGAFPRKPMFVPLRVLGFRIIKRILGPSFMTKLLERHEMGGIIAYEQAVDSGVFGSSNVKSVNEIIVEEKTHERNLLREVESNKGSLAYINSIVLGLSDSLVEVLAAVTGIAAFATSPAIVIVGGIIVGVAGTFSMAGGVYLASKSQNIVTKAIEEGSSQKSAMTEPSKDAYYTGVFYFMGALIPIIPFLLGFSGYEGILLAVALDVITLVFASTVIAIVSDTSIRHRTQEMVAVTLGTALITIVIGTIARVYFGVTI